MSDHDLDREFELSPEEERALGAVLGEPELSAAEWEVLRSNIVQAGELPLAERRRAAKSRRPASAAWLRPLLPLAAAAVLLLVLGRTFTTPNGASNGNTELSPAEQALLADVSDAEFARLVSGAADAEALLLIAAGER